MRYPRSTTIIITDARILLRLQFGGRCSRHRFPTFLADRPMFYGFSTHETSLNSNTVDQITEICRSLIRTALMPLLE